MDEAEDPKYFTDGMFIKLFNVFPPGFDPHNCHSLQKEFIVYLISVLPGADGLQRVILFNKEIERIDKSDVGDYPDEIPVDDTSKQLAKLRGISVTEYLRQELLPAVKKGKLKKIAEDWGQSIPAWVSSKYGLTGEAKADNKQLGDLIEKPGKIPSRDDVLNLRGIGGRK